VLNRFIELRRLRRTDKDLVTVLVYPLRVPLGLVHYIALSTFKPVKKHRFKDLLLALGDESRGLSLKRLETRAIETEKETLAGTICTGKR
jgi:hypothetical protein